MFSSFSDEYTHLFSTEKIKSLQVTKIQHVFYFLGTFMWIDGTSLAATGSHWRVTSGEPNNWGGSEDCAELHNDGLWNDNSCSREFAFICKKDKGVYLK